MASAWVKLVSKVYQENKSKKGYKLGDAMKTAKRLYKKTGGSSDQKSVGGSTEKKSVGGKKANKSRKSRKN